MSLIAQRYYGSLQAFDAIYAANRDRIGRSPARIAVGTVLRLPCPPGAEPAPEPEEVAALEAASEIGARWEILVGVADLLAFRPGSDVQIVDIRPEAGAGQGFIPGSIAVPFEQWQRAASPELDAAALARLIGGAGIDIGHPIVLVHERYDVLSIDQAAWVYWLLKIVGAARIAILEPGFEGWRASGQRPIRLSPRPVARRVTLTLDDRWRADGVEVARIAAGEASGALLDERVYVFVGAGAGDLAGIDRIGLGRRRAEQVLEFLKGQPIDWEQMPVISVASGDLTGAALWFYASELAGIRNVRLYPAGAPG